jgi:hypothetical protein
MPPDRRKLRRDGGGSTTWDGFAEAGGAWQHAVALGTASATSAALLLSTVTALLQYGQWLMPLC